MGSVKEKIGSVEKLRKDYNDFAKKMHSYINEFYHGNNRGKNE